MQPQLPLKCVHAQPAHVFVGTRMSVLSFPPPYLHLGAAKGRFQSPPSKVSAFSLNCERSGMSSRSPLPSRRQAWPWHRGGSCQGVWVAGSLPAGMAS